MDSKKFYKKLSTFFWLILATLPIWLSLFGFLLSSFMHTDGLTTTVDIVNTRIQYDFDTLFRKYGIMFMGFSPSFLNTMFSSLFSQLGLTYPNRDILVGCFSWFTFTYFIELMVDFIVWLPRWFHEILNKGVGKID